MSYEFDLDTLKSMSETLLGLVSDAEIRGIADNGSGRPTALVPFPNDGIALNYCALAIDEAEKIRKAPPVPNPADSVYIAAIEARTMVSTAHATLLWGCVKTEIFG